VYSEDDLVADLDAEEKENLLHTLIKLYRYHKPIFEAADEAVLGRMLGIYLIDSCLARR